MHAETALATRYEPAETVSNTDDATENLRCSSVRIPQPPFQTRRARSQPRRYPFLRLPTADLTRMPPQISAARWIAFGHGIRAQNSVQ